MKPVLLVALTLGFSMTPMFAGALLGRHPVLQGGHRTDEPQTRLQAPALEGRSLAGQDLAWSQFSERAVILYFHAPRTRNAEAALHQLSEALRQADELKSRCSVLLVVEDAEVGRAASQALAHSGQRVEVCVDEARQMAAAYEVIAFPTAFVIDPKARLVDDIRGYSSFFSFACIRASRLALGLISEAEFQASCAGKTRGRVEQDPHNALQRAMLSRLVAADQWSAALPLATRLATPENAGRDLLALAAHIELQVGDPQAALAWVERLQQKFPGDSAAAALRARISIAAGDLEEARALLEASAQRNRWQSHAHGLLLERQGKWKEAAGLYREALERDLFLLD